jgi:hypothetical protein
MAYIYDLTDNWNNSGTSFNGIKINVTDAASAADSKLLDLRINANSKFSISKTGKLTSSDVIESTTGGFKFPDGTTQATASPLSLSELDDVDLSNLVDGNVLCYAASVNKWQNQARENLVDGGNF